VENDVLRHAPLFNALDDEADVDAEAYARFVGSWGNFSAHVGQRWEQVAGDWATAHVGLPLTGGDTPFTLERVEELDHNEELHREVERVGVSCPDALFCGRDAAGHVIEAFGNFVMSGNFVIGIIVFIILVIVNFVVITKGSGRIAEVAARFHLDAMPGKQMAIDADLSAGLIDEKEARRRRQKLRIPSWSGPATKTIFATSR